MPVIVVKVGSSTIVNNDTGFLCLSNLAQLVEVICELQRGGNKVVIVSSGAVAVGVKRMGLKERPKELSAKQAVAAIGQGRLMRVYDDLFSQFNQPIAQVLLTRSDLSERSRYENSRNTFRELLAMNVIPIVNENDTVSVAEIRFGDNDTLSGLVAGLINADWLFLLTDVEHVYTANPRTDPTAEPLFVIDDIEAIKRRISISGAGSAVGTGGMETKFVAATLATSLGTATVVCMGTRPRDIVRVCAGEREVGTVFTAKPRAERMRDRKWWIQYSLPLSGTLLVDAGAVTALRSKASLFASGVVRVEGSFQAENSVRVVSRDSGQQIAIALVNYSSTEIDLIKGHKSSDIEQLLGYCDTPEIARRGDIVLLSERD